MARTRKTFSDDDARDTLSLATMLGTLPMELVRESLEATRGQSRRRRKLPHDLVMYLVIFLCVYRDKATDEVLRHLLQGIGGQLGCDGGLCATDSAISQAREAIGEEPMRLLYRSLCRPLCAREGGHGWYQGMLTCAIDASEIYLQSTQDVMREFPTAEADARNPQNCPKIKFGAVMETGSHAYIDVEFGSVLQSEQDFADALLSRIGPGRLVIGDRHCRSVLNIRLVRSQGSEALFRATSNMRLDPLVELEDGTWLAEITASRCRDRHSAGFPDLEGTVTVRVIPYAIRDSGGRDIDAGRLVTTLLDPRLYRAEDLIGIYAERWEEEMGFDEIKAHLMLGAQRSLRSKRAELVRQEFWATLIAHYIIRKIMHEAAGLARVPPNRISFVGVRDLLQRMTTAKLPPPVADSPGGGPAPGAGASRRACGACAQDAGRGGEPAAGRLQPGEAELPGVQDEVEVSPEGLLAQDTHKADSRVCPAE